MELSGNSGPYNLQPEFSPTNWQIEDAFERVMRSAKQPTVWSQEKTEHLKYVRGPVQTKQSQYRSAWVTGRFLTSQSGNIYGKRWQGTGWWHMERSVCTVDTRVCSHSPTITRLSFSGNFLFYCVPNRVIPG